MSNPKATYHPSTNSLIKNGKKHYYARVFEKQCIYTTLVYLWPSHLDEYKAQRDVDEWMRNKQKEK